jgi:heparan-alpha-glucosaminide N-acetyltransferase
MATTELVAGIGASAASAGVRVREAVDVGRIRSVDLLRGLDVWLMLFVNDLASVQGAPWYLLHRQPEPTVDGMTVTDVVFPAFLFLVGMAVPFAVSNRFGRGATPGEVWRHVLGRTLALLVLGVLMANAEVASPTGVLSPPAWTLLMTVGVILAWQAPGAGWRRVLRPLGFVLVAAAVLSFRSDAVQGVMEIRPLWWGILGLIGWAYLVASAAYLWFGDRPAVLLALLALLQGARVADDLWGVFPLPVAALDLLSTVAGHGAIAVSGLVLTVLLRNRVLLRLGGGDPWGFVRLALGYAALLAGAAFLLHRLHGIAPIFTVNKMQATVPWALYSAAATAAAWVVLFVLADVQRIRRWPAAIQLAGENALAAYLLPGLLLALVALAAGLAGRDLYAEIGAHPVPGMIRALVFAGVVVGCCALMRRAGLRVQL